MIFCSIVVPCYNEKENIPLLLEAFKKVLKNRKDIEIIMVNNGSTDGSELIFEKLLPQYPFARLETVEVNQGYGFGILHGLRSAKGKFLGWTHADLQTDPIDIIKAVKLINKYGNTSDLYIKGNRKGRPVSDTFFTFGMSVLELLLTGKWLPDINAQPNIFSREFFDQWRNPPYDFSLDLYAFYMAKKNSLHMIRFPVKFPERIHGNSKWNTGFKAKYKFIKRTTEYSIKLTKNKID